MKRLIIVCEGETEQEFCKDVLQDYFLEKDIQIAYPTIKKTYGGITRWDTLKKQIENHLKQEKDTYVTTLIDFYALPSDYPNYSKDNINSIEQGMKEDIAPSLNHRFIPYIQRHEFECFIFCSMDVLKRNFKPEEANFIELEKVAYTFAANMEDINNSPETAPSKRLLKSINGYNKVVYGACLAYEIGLNKIREKCPRFDHWIDRLEHIK
ncbi:DUF4276 family protein [Bacteroides sp. 224]|uniref:DUF4276 family protein n=1 Tax=Bacteroides sp. 224 TaxID=2302936 RepID=UPI0013D7E261|nr:DUF4276 family protein [Bacteroides sp. 224]NDV67093.1 DUF4276 family protein [Bacteroides sp. 224]